MGKLLMRMMKGYVKQEIAAWISERALKLGLADKKYMMKKANISEEQLDILISVLRIHIIEKLDSF